jgi:hypothetical protein
MGESSRLRRDTAFRRRVVAMQHRAARCTFIGRGRLQLLSRADGGTRARNIEVSRSRSRKRSHQIQPRDRARPHRGPRCSKLAGPRKESSSAGPRLSCQKMGRLRIEMTPSRRALKKYLQCKLVFSSSIVYSVANVVFPHIAGSVGATQQEATWVLTPYVVPSAIILPRSAATRPPDTNPRAIVESAPATA